MPGKKTQKPQKDKISPRKTSTPSGFTMVTNPMYDLPPDYAPQQLDIPTRPQTVHIPISN